MMIGEHRFRVRLLGSGKTTYGKVKAQLGIDLDLHVHDTGNGREFVICANSVDRMQRARSALAAARLEEITGSTDVAIQPSPRPLSGSRGQPPKPEGHHINESNRSPVRRILAKHRTRSCRFRIAFRPLSQSGVTVRAVRDAFRARFASSWRTLLHCW